MDIEYYKKLILKTLYDGFMKNPPNRVKNDDIDSVFVKIDDVTHFRIAREQLIKESLIHGKNINSGDPRYLQLTGSGIVYYERNYILPSIKREYTLLASKFLIFLRDIGNKKYDICNFVSSQDKRSKPSKVPRDFVNQVMKNDYNYTMSDLKWLQLYFTSGFINKHIMGINGIGFGNNYISLHNPDSFCLNLEGYNFLNEIFLYEKFQKISNQYGKERVTQLFDDLAMWISRKCWVDVAINMGVIIEYCIDNYIGVKHLSEFYNKNNNIRENFSKKVGIILQNPKFSSDPIYDIQYRANWKRIQNVLRDWRNYIHITKLVKEQSPLDEQSIQKFYGDFESILNILLNL